MGSSIIMLRVVALTIIASLLVISIGESTEVRSWPKTTDATTTVAPDPPNCLDCVVDIVTTVEDCADIAPDDEEAYIKCVEDALIAAADCVECICEVMEIITDIDVPLCG